MTNNLVRFNESIHHAFCQVILAYTLEGLGAPSILWYAYLLQYHLCNIKQSCTYHIERNGFSRFSWSHLVC